MGPILQTKQIDYLRIIVWQVGFAILSIHSTVWVKLTLLPLFWLCFNLFGILPFLFGHLVRTFGRLWLGQMLSFIVRRSRNMYCSLLSRSLLLLLVCCWPYGMGGHYIRKYYCSSSLHEYVRIASFCFLLILFQVIFYFKIT